MARFVQKAKFVDFPSIVVIGIAVAAPLIALLVAA